AIADNGEAQIRAAGPLDHHIRIGHERKILGRVYAIENWPHGWPDRRDPRLPGIETGWNPRLALIHPHAPEERAALGRIIRPAADRQHADHHLRAIEALHERRAVRPALGDWERAPDGTIGKLSIANASRQHPAQ